MLELLEERKQQKLQTVENWLDQAPPHDLDLERTVLKALHTGAGVRSDEAELLASYTVLETDDFHAQLHGQVFEVLQAAWLARADVAGVKLFERVRDMGLFQVWEAEWGGVYARLAEIFLDPKIAGRAQLLHYHVPRLRRLRLSREIRRESWLLVQWAYADECDPIQWSIAAVKTLTAMAKKHAVLCRTLNERFTTPSSSSPDRMSRSGPSESF